MKCEWVEEGVRCGCDAAYRTHWYWHVCKGHGLLLMANHGIDYLVDIEEPQPAVYSGSGENIAQQALCDKWRSLK